MLQILSAIWLIRSFNIQTKFILKYNSRLNDKAPKSKGLNVGFLHIYK